MSYIGIDAGGTWIKGARFGSDFVEEASCRLASGAQTGAKEYFASIAQAIEECRDDLVTNVGVAVPGILDPARRRLLFGANIVDLNGSNMEPVDLAAALTGAGVALPFAFENDANCAALAEWQRGEGQGDAAVRLLHVTWGTGIGTGFVADGAVHYGWEGGHIPLTYSFEPTPDNLSQETLEWHAGVTHMVRRAEALLEQGEHETRLTSRDFADRAETSKVLVWLAEEGDVLSLQVVDNALAALAQGLHTMALIAYPTVVTVGGAMMNNAWLLPRLQEHVLKRMAGIRQTSLKPDMIRRGQLGNEAGVLGAAMIAKQA